jgi:lysophospholipase L1-like esterase
MGKYKTFGSRFDRVHRNDLNANFAAVEADINAQKGRVDDLIIGTPQPSEVVDSRGGFPVLGDRLESISSTVAQKVSKGEIVSADLKTLNESDRLGLANLKQEVIQAIAGTTAVNQIPADKSVTPIRTSFFNFGNNLFNKNDITSDKYVDSTTGNLVTATGFVVSGFINVSSSTAYIIKHARHYAFYDVNKTFISGLNAGSPFNNITFTTPSNCVYVKFSWTVAAVSVSIQQMNVGSTLLSYEEFKQFIPRELIQKPIIAGSDIEEKTIPLSKTLFYTESTNLYNKDAITNNAYVDSSNGTIVTGSNGFVACDFIPIKSSTAYAISRARHIAFYDTNKAFISGQTTTAGVVVNITTPSNAKYMRTSYYPSSDLLPIDYMQVNEGSTLLSFQKYGGFIPLTNIEPKKTVGVLPSTIHAVVGKEVYIYFQNILRDKLENYQIDVVCSIGNQETYRWTCTPASAGTYPLTINIYSDYVNLIASLSTNIVVKAANVGNGVNKKVIAIGDSTLNAGTATQRLLDLMAPDVMDVTLYGSRGTAPNVHEGRGGWAAATYLTNTVYAGDGLVNPFYNGGTFDFSYYMTQKGYPVPDYVVIWLGINDVFDPTTDGDLNILITTVLTKYDTIINSIKAYNSNIKIGVNITIPPNESQDAFGLAYGSGQTQWRYKRNNSLWIEQLINHFKSISGVYLIPMNNNIDCKNNINDGVHPKAEGYNQMGDALYYWMKSFEA